jgi:hypothetical protein
MEIFCSRQIIPQRCTEWANEWYFSLGGANCLIPGKSSSPLYFEIKHENFNEISSESREFVIWHSAVFLSCGQSPTFEFDFRLPCFKGLFQIFSQKQFHSISNPPRYRLLELNSPFASSHSDSRVSCSKDLFQIIFRIKCHRILNPPKNWSFELDPPLGFFVPRHPLRLPTATRLTQTFILHYLLSEFVSSDFQSPFSSPWWHFFDKMIAISTKKSCAVPHSRPLQMNTEAWLLSRTWSLTPNVNSFMSFGGQISNAA